MEAGSQEVGKRKREDDMTALEAAVTATSDITGTRLPGFVSAGVVQPDQRQHPPDAEATPAGKARLLLNFFWSSFRG